MSSRQLPTAAQDAEEDVVSATGEGDEIMEEPEEQEDGYSAYSFERAYPIFILRNLQNE